MLGRLPNLEIQVGAEKYLDKPISSRAWRAGIDSLLLMNSDPSSVSAADDMTNLIVLEVVNTASLLGGNSVLLGIKKCPLAMLLAFILERYEALLWPARTISLVWYVMLGYGWVAA